MRVSCKEKIRCSDENNVTRESKKKNTFRKTTNALEGGGVKRDAVEFHSVTDWHSKGQFSVNLKMDGDSYDWILALKIRKKIIINSIETLFVPNKILLIDCYWLDT